MTSFDRDRVSRRAFLAATAGALTLPFIPEETIVADGMPSYNGIRLPRPWPPVRPAFSVSPVTPPYLRDRARSQRTWSGLSSFVRL